MENVTNHLHYRRDTHLSTIYKDPRLFPCGIFRRYVKWKICYAFQFALIYFVTEIELLLESQQNLAALSAQLTLPATDLTQASVSGLV